MSESTAPLEPANSIISRLGGPDKVREITNASRTRVYRWTQPRENGGTNGVIPTRHAAKILAFAREQGIQISAEEFIGGVSAAD